MNMNFYVVVKLGFIIDFKGCFGCEDFCISWFFFYIILFNR